ncbi:hypothetical protein Tco_0550218 [Tanacetum coccineum]
MTGNKSLFSTYKAYDGGSVVFGSNLKGKIIGKVSVKFVIISVEYYLRKKAELYMILLLNNICDVFNKQLVDGKDQPIIICLEYIREYLMKRIVVAQKVIAKTDGPLTPSMTALFDAIKKLLTTLKWELTETPCKHVVAAIYNMFENSMGVGIPEHWVHAAYRLETWAHVYSFKMNPFGSPPKKRKKSHDEIASQSCSSGKLSRKAGARQAAGARNVSSQAAGSRNASSQAVGSIVNPVQHQAQQLVQGMPQVKLLVLVNLVQHQAQQANDQFNIVHD